MSKYVRATKFIMKKEKMELEGINAIRFLGRVITTAT